MAQPDDAEIEKVLQRIVRRRAAKGEEVTVKRVRAQAETALDLDDGFFKDDPKWNKKSREVISAAYEEDEDGANAEAPKSAPKPADSKAAKASKVKTAEKPKTKDQEGGKKENGAAKAPAPAVRRSSSSKQSEEEKGPVKAAPAALKKPNGIPGQVNGVKRKASEQSSSEESSESDEESDEAAAPPGKKAKTESSSSSSETSSESLEDDEPKPPTTQDDSRPPPAQTIKSTNIQAIPAQPFQPPHGFTPISSQQLSSSSQQPLTPSNLQGKQIWHITAPSALPLTTLTSIPLSALDTSHVVLNHDGSEFILSLDPHPTSAASSLLLPTAEGYTRHPTPITRTLHLKQKISLPNLSARQASQATGSGAAGSVAQPPVSGARPQPRGLRMRYRPPGFGVGELGAVGSGSESAGEEEEEEGETGLQFPKALGGHGPRGRDGVGMDGDVVERGNKRRRKEKVKPKTDGAREELRSSVMAAPGVEAPAVQTPGVETPAVNGVSPDASTAEDKAKRKEEKRLKRERKEAKRKAKEVAGL
ncbi:uncharacterized protein LTR77_003222 [Saxophila tyrrhenica]|uniref:Uncharacterized protein n=1 Tax=Saxophila tyrrhenica TaxID=1690608 RepID=A0AAV9PLE2_9PEZI|nr:hypothetical protein LTR77_003222 [Saxophila tyrrhenica]